MVEKAEVLDGIAVAADWCSENDEMELAEKLDRIYQEVGDAMLSDLPLDR